MKDYSKIEEMFRLHASGKGAPDIIPDGWITIEGVATNLNVSVTTARMKINQLVAKGLLDSKVFRVDIGCRVYPIRHFKPKA